MGKLSQGWLKNTAPLLFQGRMSNSPLNRVWFYTAPCFILVKTMAGKRPDQNGTHRTVFERNKKKIYATQSVCGICGMPVDFTVKYPHPLSPCIDHIIPIAKGGHPSDIDNLQLAHWICNRQKSDKLMIRAEEQAKEDIGNNNLPWSIDWESYRA